MLLLYVDGVQVVPVGMASAVVADMAVHTFGAGQEERDTDRGVVVARFASLGLVVQPARLVESD